MLTQIFLRHAKRSATVDLLDTKEEMQNEKDNSGYGSCRGNGTCGRRLRFIFIIRISSFFCIIGGDIGSGIGCFRGSFGCILCIIGFRSRRLQPAGIL